jgi:hypothetical protein
VKQRVCTANLKKLFIFHCQLVNSSWHAIPSCLSCQLTKNYLKWWRVSIRKTNENFSVYINLYSAVCIETL